MLLEPLLVFFKKEKYIWTLQIDSILFFINLKVVHINEEIGSLQLGYCSNYVVKSLSTVWSWSYCLEKIDLIFSELLILN